MKIMKTKKEKYEQYKRFINSYELREELANFKLSTEKGWHVNGLSTEDSLRIKKHLNDEQLFILNMGSKKNISLRELSDRYLKKFGKGVNGKNVRQVEKQTVDIICYWSWRLKKVSRELKNLEDALDFTTSVKIF